MLQPHDQIQAQQDMEEKLTADYDRVLMLLCQVNGLIPWCSFHTSQDYDSALEEYQLVSEKVRETRLGLWLAIDSQVRLNQMLMG